METHDSTLLTEPQTPSTSKVLRKYFGEFRSLSETARDLGMKRGAVEWTIKQAGLKLRPMGEAVSRAKLGRPRHKLPLRAHPGEAPVDKWKIVELKVAGKSNQEIAKLLNRSQPSIYMALRRMGFPDGTGVTACYSFGEYFDRDGLRRFHEISGLNVTDLADKLGVPFATLEPALSTRQSQRQMHFNTARRASQWLKTLFNRLMSGASRNPGRQTSKYSQSRIIVTFFPNFKKRYAFLLEVLHRIGHKLRENPEWSLDDLQQYLCEQAMLEKAAGRGELFSRFLPWAPDLMPFFAGKLQDLRGVRHQRIAWDVLAGSLGTTASTISAIVNPAQVQKIRPIPAEQMRSLLLNWNPPEPPKSAGGAPAKWSAAFLESCIAERAGLKSWAKVAVKVLSKEAIEKKGGVRSAGEKIRLAVGYYITKRKTRSPKPHRATILPN